MYWICPRCNVFIASQRSDCTIPISTTYNFSIYSSILRYGCKCDGSQLESNRMVTLTTYGWWTFGGCCLVRIRTMLWSGRPIYPTPPPRMLWLEKIGWKIACCRCVRRDCGIHFRMVICTKIVLPLGQVGSCFIHEFFRDVPDIIVVTGGSAV
jgi:hypothetical protein